MTDERWTELVGRIKDTFRVEQESTERVAEGRGTKRVVVFSSDQGTIKLEYWRHPAIIGTHGIQSRRIGSSAKIAYSYSPTEEVGYLKAYRLVGQDWKEIDAEAFSGNPPPVEKAP